MAAPSCLRTDQVYPRLAGYVRRTLSGLGIAAGDVEDVTHDVFVTMHRKGCTFEDEPSARAWLYATARRIASNERRARRRAQARQPAWVPAEPPCPERVVGQREAADAVHRFASGLSGNAQQVFRLSEIEGLPAPRVASALGLNLNTTYSLIRRVRHKLARSALAGLGLLLLALAALCGACAAEADDAERDRLALRDGADLAG